MKKKRSRFAWTGGIVALTSGLAALPMMMRSCEPATLYGPPTAYFDPEMNEPEDVYGPPVDFEEPDGEYDAPAPEEDFDPAENIPPPVYGPPPDDLPEPVWPDA